jgi:hypothetical protein
MYSDIKLTTVDAASVIKSEVRRTRRTYRRSGAPMNLFGRFFFLRCASPISRVNIAAPIVLAQYKGHKRIGEARKRIHRASPIVTELA